MDSISIGHLAKIKTVKKKNKQMYWLWVGIVCIVVFCLLWIVSCKCKWIASFASLCALPLIHRTPTTPMRTNICMYMADDHRDIENLSFRDLSILSRAIQSHPAPVVYHILLDTKTMGRFRGRLSGQTGELRLTACPDMNMADPRTLANFVSEALTEHPAEQYVFVYAGHGYGWYARMEEDKYMSIQQLSMALQCAKTHWSAIVLDTCLMSTAETLIELAPQTDLILACQDYGPSSGFMCSEFVQCFATASDSNLVTGFRKVVESFIRRNTHVKESCDAVLLSTKHASALLETLSRIPAHTIRCANDSDARIDSDDVNSQNWLVDLCTVLNDCKCETNAEAIDAAIHCIQENIVLGYAQSPDKRACANAHAMHGLSFYAKLIFESPTICDLHKPLRTSRSIPWFGHVA